MIARANVGKRGTRCEHPVQELEAICNDARTLCPGTRFQHYCELWLEYATFFESPSVVSATRLIGHVARAADSESYAKSRHRIGLWLKRWDDVRALQNGLGRADLHPAVREWWQCMLGFMFKKSLLLPPETLPVGPV